MVKNYIIAGLLGAVACLTGFVAMPIWMMEICAACMVTGVYLIRDADPELEADGPAEPKEETFQTWIEVGTIRK